jgi:hypothetical protein
MQLNIVSSSSQTSSLGALRNARVSTQSDLDAPKDKESASGPAQLFKKLEALAKSDPAKFKETTAAMAKKVQEAADAATDPRAKAMLTDLATKFTTASQSGDASGLKPPERGAGGGRPPPPAGGGKGASVSSQQQFDPADTNEDGKVSEPERIAYEAKQEASRAVGAYSRSMKDAQESKGHALFDSLSQMVDGATAS